MLYKSEYHLPEKARELLLAAFRLKPDCRALAVETAMQLTEDGRRRAMAGPVRQPFAGACGPADAAGFCGPWRCCIWAGWRKPPKS